MTHPASRCGRTGCVARPDQLVTRSTSVPPISFSASMPSVTAVVACCATSLATRVTRWIGVRFALRVAPLAVFVRDALLLPAPRLALDLAPPRARFAEAFVMTRGVPRLAVDFRAVALFFALAPRLPPRFFAPPRFLAAGRLEDALLLVPPDFPRDFLARVAIVLSSESVVKVKENSRKRRTR